MKILISQRSYFTRQANVVKRASASVGIFLAVFIMMLFSQFALKPNDVSAQHSISVSSFYSNGTAYMRWNVTTDQWLWKVRVSYQAGAVIQSNLDLNVNSWAVPDQSTSRTYRITLYNPDNPSVEQAATTHTVAIQQIPQCSISGPATITSGQSFDIYWGVTGATNPTINYFPATVNPARMNNVTATTTYTLRASNARASCSASHTVNVAAVNNFRFVNNRPAIPARYNHVSNSDCGGGLLHARHVWLSGQNTASESVTAASGAPSVGARMNIVGKVCEGVGYTNVDPGHGGVDNQSVDQDAYYIRSSSISSSPAISGLSSDINGKLVQINRSAQYAARPGQVWTSIGSANFNVSGLGNATPGQTYYITVAAQAVPTALLNGSRVCVSGQVPTSGVTGPNCNAVSASLTISVTIPNDSDPTGPNCSIFGPVPSVISPGGSAVFGWFASGVSSVILRNDTTLEQNAVSNDVEEYTVTAPEGSEDDLQYSIIAIAPDGSQRVCPIFIAVTTGPEESPKFNCEPIFYQTYFRFGEIPPVYKFAKLDVATGTYIDINPFVDVPQINAIGYNIQDDYIYGFSKIPTGNTARHQLRRLDAQGNTTQIPIKLGVTNNDFIVGNNRAIVVGDFDNNGNLWVVSIPALPNDPAPSYVYRVDVDDGNGVARAYTMLTDNSGSLRRIQDWVYINGSFYGVFVNGPSVQLVRFPTTATNINDVVFRPFTAPTPPSAKPYGAMWTTQDGKLYAGYNGGAIYRITNYEISPVSPAPSIQPVLSVPETEGNDGASCPNAKDPLAKVNYPFIRAQGSDVISGAVFADSGNSCSARRTAYSATGNIRTNGFRPHIYSATSDSGIRNGSSSAQYAAFAYGVIGSGKTSSNSFVTNNGYYNSAASGSVRDIMFANDLTGGISDYGEYYSSSKASLPCVDISEIEGQDSVAVATSGDITTQVAAGATVLRASGDITVPSLTIASGRKVVLIVEGTATISGNINILQPTVPGGNLNVGSFALIAKGGLNINQGVSIIDGYYIAHNSTLSTCPWIGGPPTIFTCNNKLTVNGLLSGGTIRWHRNYGTLNSNVNTLSASPSSQCAVGSQPSTANVSVEEFDANVEALQTCSAEYINFDPVLYFANPFTLQDQQGGVGNQPLSTIELPPIY